MNVLHFPVIFIAIVIFMHEESNDIVRIIHFHSNDSSGSRGAEGAMVPPGPVKIGHKKDGH